MDDQRPDCDAILRADHFVQKRHDIYGECRSPVFDNFACSRQVVDVNVVTTEYIGIAGRAFTGTLRRYAVICIGRKRVASPTRTTDYQKH